MPGLKRLRSVRITAAGHAFIQNLRRRQYDDVADEPPLARVRVVRQVRRSAKLIEGHMTVWQPVRSCQQHQLKERSIFRVSITEGIMLPDHESIVPAPSTHSPT